MNANENYSIEKLEKQLEEDQTRLKEEKEKLANQIGHFVINNFKIKSTEDFNKEIKPLLTNISSNKINQEENTKQSGNNQDKENSNNTKEENTKENSNSKSHKHSFFKSNKNNNSQDENDDDKLVFPSYNEIQNQQNKGNNSKKKGHRNNFPW